MKTVALAFVLITGFCSLAACGFTPVHSSTVGLGSPSSNITIPEIPGRGGHELRKALVEEFAAGLPGIETATFTVSLTERLNPLSIRPDEAAARTDFISIGRYVFDTGETVLTGTVRANTSYNVPFSVFGDVASQQAATKSLMSVLAQRITDDIKLKLVNEAP